MEDQPRPAERARYASEGPQRIPPLPRRADRLVPLEIQEAGELPLIEYVTTPTRIEVTRAQAEWLAQFLFAAFAPRTSWQGLTPTTKARYTSAVEAGLARLGVDVEWDAQMLGSQQGIQAGKPDDD